MAKTITTRLPEDFVLEINKLAKKENLDMSAVIRRLLANALKQERLKEVINSLSSHKISIGQAALKLNISLWDMMDLAKERNIDWNEYVESDLEKDIQILQ
mgnify:CR=1 FL=1|jgi:predicted HTH domain antitoxin|tara:strand:- start:962 stop:1264 length:303 start_codon:yes stop_codon:yes gene_type:complete